MKTGLLSCMFLIAACSVCAQTLVETGHWDTDQAAVQQSLPALQTISFKELATYSENLQRYIFVQLPADEKARIWQERIDYYLQTNRESAEVIAVFKELMALLQASVFESPDGMLTLEKWARSHVKEIGIDKMAYVVTGMRLAPFGLGNLPAPHPGTGTSPSPTTLSCGCSQTSDWCGGGAYCKTWNCNIVTSGCGFMWSYDCNGRCFTPND